MKWWEIKQTVSRNQADVISALWLEMQDVQGVAVEGRTEDEPPHPEFGEWFDESLLETDQQVVRVYFPETYKEADIAALVAGVERSVFQILSEERNVLSEWSLVDEEEWADGWKHEYVPVPVGRRLLVIPNWDQHVDTQRVSVRLEPGMAFGTGTHETTQLAMEALERITLADKRVLDVGCGTAILAITAAKLGAKEVQALDVDPVAVSVAKENVRLNEVHVEVSQGDLLKGFSKEVRYDVIVANILRDIVIELIPEARSRLMPGGLLLVSGFVEQHAPQVEEALLQSGFQTIHRYQKNDWILLEASYT
ncbi:50S ribosomal protein L11 methyltransferase [Alicyclobacillus tolerans]|uniref:Ribosomal protein L11 methyltransferase n=1 Tax=Alicyclobacillus tolerans TaxID=90970 RepID=A0A1M6JXQ1_9BACL|nr:50S ribosomal protein L11 methyltransferase [Alicyclobacillus montanus]SHJ51432.1 [LSU ribosomal protein L11P]-lysine N-methyltransferase [Alicyclobacillus montanus]